MEATGVLDDTSPSVTGPRTAPLRVGRYVVKLAETEEEWAQLHHLNCQTFAHELSQHDDPGNGRLVDKFHDKNIYFAAFDQGRAVGMLAVHDQPPFSITDKMADPARLEQLGSRQLEVRLLAIEPAHRHNELFAGLLFAVYEFAHHAHYTHMLISGVVDRQRMYERIGFRPLGPPVYSGGVRFVPMAVRLDQFPHRIVARADRLRARLSALSLERHARPIALTPGPAQLSQAVRQALHKDQLSHRGRQFDQTFRRVRSTLASLVGLDVALFSGSGTLVNEVVAATLAADRRCGTGLVLVNGEFGRRLVRQAHCAGLRFGTLRWHWGRPWEFDRIDAYLKRRPEIDWVWAVHLESSTGMLNDVAALGQLVERHGRRLCLDCISSLGAVPVDLRRVHLATGVSNKSVGGVAGVSMVFARPDALTHVNRHRTPPYLDLVDAMTTPGPCYTFPSAPLLALDAALQVYADSRRRAARYGRYVQLGRYVRGQLDALGLAPLVREPYACPVITTFRVGTNGTHDRFIARCRDFGYAVGGESGYLSRRNWCQVATMGELSIDDCRPLFDRLAVWLERERPLEPEARRDVRSG